MKKVYEEYKDQVMMDYTEDVYTEQLQELFDSEDFYAQPKNTKLYLSFNGGKDFELIGNAVIANFQETNEKIPVYSYNSPTYNKYLQGKKIVSGVMVLRKITIDHFLSMKSVDTKSSINGYDDLIGRYQFEIIELKKLTNLIPESLIKSLETKIENIKKDQETYEREEWKKFNLINYIEHSGGKGKFSKETSCIIKIEFQTLINEDFKDNCIKLKNVLITRKETEVTVEKNDIFEVYNFIGNPVEEQ